MLVGFGIFIYSDTFSM